jgi:peptidyl-prolyl cis-trans isomerase C
MTDEELLVQRGLALALPDTTTEVRETLATAVTRQVAEPLLAQPLTDAQLRAYYDQHVRDYETDGSMTLRDLVLHIGGYQNADQSSAQGETDASEAVYRLRSGATPDYIKEHFGFEDSGRVYDGEQLEFAAKVRLGPKLYPVARTLADGEVSDPVTDSDGIHVLIMERRLPPRPVGFDAARDRIYTALRAAQSKLASQQNLQLLRREARIVLAPGVSE